MSRRATAWLPEIQRDFPSRRSKPRLHPRNTMASADPHCGAPYPAREHWDGWGFEYKSKLTFFDLPLVHISFKYRSNFMPVPAKGIISIGQFGIGVISISQFTIALYAVAQFAIAYSLIAQIGLYINHGVGQAVWKLFGSTPTF